MQKNSSYIGIETNNLKNIDFMLAHNNISLLMGASGSGKSSLAINTIYKISLNELNQLMNLKESPSIYAIKEYQNILPSIALLQENYNKNPRSIIATYFKMDIFFKRLFAQTNQVSTSLFQFNKYETSCKKCLGLGFTLYPDLKKIIDYDIKIKDIPFKNWKSSYANYYSRLIKLYCKDNDINIEYKFNDLDNLSKEKLLYGTSDVKYKINYKVGSRKRVKTSKYISPINELKEQLNPTEREKKFYSQQVCTFCNGYRFSPKVLSYKIYEKNIGELYNMDIESLQSWILSKKSYWEKSNTESIAFKQILSFIEKMIELNLEYINLNRAIPTLSGGELQRLRFSKAINSQFSNFLYIFDEPSSGLHPNEWEDILNAIVKIKNKNNTIIIIEHNEVFKSIADKTFILGGDNGGEIIKNSKDITNDINFKYSFFESNKQISIKNETYNNIKNLSTSIQIENTLTVICGKSGSGKTSFLKWILPKYCTNPTYLDQSPLKGNNYSILSTYLGIFDEIKKMYADKTKLDIDCFSFHHSSIGKCNSCNGTGLLRDEIDNTNTICPNCNGKRFSKLTLKSKVNDINIYELLNLTINDLIQIIPKELKKTNKVLSFLQYINLGYLSLFREVSSLSGGEAQRIKICNIFFKYKRSRTFLLDEPFRGLDYNSKHKLVQFLYQIINKGNTIFIVEHDIIAIKNSSYIIEFGPKSGIHGGTILYNGKKDDIYNSEQSIIKQYL